MKSLLLKVLLFVACLMPILAMAQNGYFFPAGTSFDSSVPSPRQFLGYDIGDFHTRHDRIVSYMETLAQNSNKVHIQQIGFTYERRPQVILTITAPENYARLEEVRTAHLDLCDPSKPEPSLNDMPVIVHLGYSVHGNEPSTSEAAMLIAYYLTAAQGPEVEEFLKSAIIFIDPVLNPDGRDRHTSWVNSHRGEPLVADALDREHNEAWPSGRTNHYWFDLNRDWLPLVHVESKNRMAFYHNWLPNVVTDYHEMGTNSTYFFEPTEPYGSENPVVPRSNYEGLNNLFAKYYVEALDEMGSLYFTKEVFDNSYPGYGSTYPDIQGGLGMVFEQASSRGHLQNTTTKPLTFPFTIRNHLRTSLATVKASVENHEKLLKHQRDFFKSASNEGKRSAVKGYVFGDENDKNRTKAFLELMLRHRIKTYELNRELKLSGSTFKPGHAFVVPTDQPQYRMVRSMFEKVTSFHDSVFYDASSWTMSLAYGMPHAEIRSGLSLGKEMGFEDMETKIAPVVEASYAYVFEWSDYNAPKALYHLIDKGVFAKAAFKPFTINTTKGSQNFGYGSIVIPVADQNISKDQLLGMMQETSSLTMVNVHSVNSGYSLQGIDLGSGNMRTIQKPKVCMLIGDGISSYEAGEVWFVLDHKLNMPVTKVDVTDFRRVDLNQFNTLVLVSGNYNFLSDGQVNSIKQWVRQGGTLVTQRTATQWAVRKGLTSESLKSKKETKAPRRNYADAREYIGAKAIGGSIYQTDLDITHPLGFGYKNRDLSVYRNHTVFLEPSKNPYSTVVKYTANPLQGGYIHADNLDIIKNSASLLVSGQGRGRVVLFADNPNFRGFWYGTNKLFYNALFFGSHISVPGR
ncbi:MAG: M14 family zinc carboxypeptidase [Bacteroidota bacterium]